MVYEFTRIPFRERGTTGHTGLQPMLDVNRGIGRPRTHSDAQMTPSTTEMACYSAFLSYPSPVSSRCQPDNNHPSHSCPAAFIGGGIQEVIRGNTPQRLMDTRTSESSSAKG